MRNSINSNEAEMEAKRQAKMQRKALEVINGEGNEEQKKEALEELFEGGLDVNSVKDNIGRSLLHIAAKNGSIAIIRFLLEKGSAVDFKNVRNKMTPLFYSFDNSSNIDVAKTLIFHDANVNAEDNYGDTPLRNAVEIAIEIDRIKTLIDNGADVNDKNNAGRTLIHEVENFFTIFTSYNAVHESNLIKIAKILVSAGGIDVNAKDDEGKTPLHIAAEKNLIKIAEILVSADDINVNAKNDRGETPLHIAARHGNPDVIKILTDADKIDVNAKNDRGETPLRLAVVNGNTDAVEILTDAADKIKVNANPGEVPGTSPTNIPDSVEKYTKQQTETERKL